MKWLVIIAVIAVIAALLALDWWTSRKPLHQRQDERGMTETEQAAHEGHGFRNASNNSGHGLGGI